MKKILTVFLFTICLVCSPSLTRASSMDFSPQSYGETKEVEFYVIYQKIEDILPKYPYISNNVQEGCFFGIVPLYSTETLTSNQIKATYRGIVTNNTPLGTFCTPR
ncbi:hypothetical protein [Bacillus halotolerans]|uniref:hypothetical protein n=1 Tax=Bacillus halotolerans TaxID=260554 RepID=UPI00187A0C64|nr:hypothetical protein [Bacillus halotolerans]MEC1545597.1 hypothetical protein [Bacillus halotolerans]